MRSIILLVVLAVLLTACGRPAPMNSATAEAIKECLDKGWMPRYFSDGDRTDFVCEPPPGWKDAGPDS